MVWDQALDGTDGFQYSFPGDSLEQGLVLRTVAEKEVDSLWKSELHIWKKKERKKERKEKSKLKGCQSVKSTSESFRTSARCKGEGERERYKHFSSLFSNPLPIYLFLLLLLPFIPDRTEKKNLF